MQIVIKNMIILTDTAYNRLYQAPFLEIIYRYDIRRNGQNQNTDFSNIEIRNDVFKSVT